VGVDQCALVLSLEYRLHYALPIWKTHVIYIPGIYRAPNASLVVWTVFWLRLSVSPEAEAVVSLLLLPVIPMSKCYSRGNTKMLCALPR